MSNTARPKPVMLCILDGWGDRAPAVDNAISIAATPTWDALLAKYPHSRLSASALEVGLPEGQMGNSEVGHMNLGAGRVVMQELPKIDLAVRNDTLKNEPALKDFISALKKSGGTCHLLGLLSPGGVHSHQDHMVAIAKAITAEGIPVRVHGFLDGRDTPPKAAKGYIEKFEADIAGFKNCRIATISGRYFALDRDNRWDRLEKSYACMAESKGEPFGNAIDVVDAAYADGKTDEFILPAPIAGYEGMRDGDGVMMSNFRADRAREIMSALCAPAFDGFIRPRKIAFAAALGMVEYSKAHAAFMTAIFPPTQLSHILGEVVSEAGLRQLRIAETEKYAHVTFFLNGGREDVFAGEERILVPSPKVATYDLQPEMSAPEVTDKLVAAIGSGSFDLIIVNYANGDMVGHTGILEAAVKAAETIDASLARLEKAIIDAGGVMLVTADHGNCEQMQEPDGGAHTQHTLNLVPFIMVNAPIYVHGLSEGRLSDVAPTLLRLLELPQPAEMTGRCLIKENTAESAAAE
ncbi:MAG: 2,3-bisphosphoglycerate-independent phosphoglycerate mutase [Rhodospirillales bacterium]|nr:2,3-bisphosphoglycerate-independent phosphoglycerate mutase [Rhodospirillales bacterium]